MSTTATLSQATRNLHRADRAAGRVFRHVEPFIWTVDLLDNDRVSVLLQGGTVRVLFEEAAVVTVQSGEVSYRNGRFYDQSSAQFTGDFNASGVNAYIDSLD